MTAAQRTVRLCLVGLALLSATPTHAEAQGPRRPSQTPAAADVAHARRSANLPLIYQAPASRSATRTILSHVLVGTGAGALIGAVLSGTDASDDDAGVVLVWTSVGALAGAASGVVTWLTDR